MYEEVCGGVNVLSAVAKVNKAASGSSDELLTSLNDENVHLVAVESENLTAYQQAILTAQQNKQQVGYSHLYRLPGLVWEL